MQSQSTVKGLRAATACATQLVLTVNLTFIILAQVGGAAQPPSASAQLAAADPLAAGPLQTRVSSVKFLSRRQQRVITQLDHCRHTYLVYVQVNGKNLPGVRIKALGGSGRPSCSQGVADAPCLPCDAAQTCERDLAPTACEICYTNLNICLHLVRHQAMRVTDPCSALELN